MIPDAMLAELVTFGQVILIDIVLAGDNAIIVALAAAGLAQPERRRAIAIGIAIAIVLRILFALVAVQLLEIIGLLLAGGLLLLWVAWKLWREIREGHGTGIEAVTDDGGEIAAHEPKKFSAAVWQIAIADVSMSLDNVLAVAGAAHGHTVALVFGLVLSVALMGIAATFIARLMNRASWLQYVGVLVIAYVAGMMIYEGARDVFVVMAGT